MKKGVLVVFLILILGLSLITSYKMTSYKRTPVEIYVPCGMIVPFQEAIKGFEAENRGTKVNAHYDTGAVLVRLILNKDKRPDIFVSAGNVEMKNLIDNDLINNDTVREFGKFNLVLYSSAYNPAQISDIQDLAKPEVQTIALSDPRFNSVGSYAKEALENSGLWDTVKDKIVFTDSPIQALTLVASGKAQAGLHYDNCPFDTAPQKINVETVKIIQKIPQQYYKPIVSKLAILKDSKNKKLALIFLEYILSKKGLAILKNAGMPNISNHLEKSAMMKVKIEAYYPFNEEHKFVGDYLKTFEKKYPEKVSVRLIDFRTSEGYDEWRKTGLSCGGILINDKSEFDIDSSDGKKTIRFLRRVDTFWSREDFEKVIEVEIKK